MNIVLYKRVGVTDKEKPIRQAVFSVDTPDKDADAALKLQTKKISLFQEADKSGAPAPVLDIILEDWKTDASGKVHTAEFTPLDNNLKPMVKEPYDKLEDC